MKLLGFGQPLGAICQYAYVVEDIHRSVGQHADVLGVGPWYLRSHFEPPAGLYRGKPSRPTLSLARAFSGTVMIELIQQHDGGVSVYHEAAGKRDFGFHHWAIMTRSFSDDLQRYRDLGYQQAYSDQLPSGAQVAYIDTHRDLGGMVELVEHTPEQERMYTAIYLASVGWDRTNLVRPDSDLGRQESSQDPQGKRARSSDGDITKS